MRWPSECSEHDGRPSAACAKSACQISRATCVWCLSRPDQLLCACRWVHASSDRLGGQPHRHLRAVVASRSMPRPIDAALPLRFSIAGAPGVCAERCCSTRLGRCRAMASGEWRAQVGKHTLTTIISNHFLSTLFQRRHRAWARITLPPKQRAVLRVSIGCTSMSVNESDDPALRRLSRWGWCMRAGRGSVTPT